VIEQAVRRAVQRQGKADRFNLKALHWAAITLLQILTAAAWALRVKQADKVGNRLFIEGNNAARWAASTAAPRCAPGIDHAVLVARRGVPEALAASSASMRKTGKHNFGIIQAEDGLASSGIVIGAGWNGARPFTATSGPGISLMTEFIGLAISPRFPPPSSTCSAAGLRPACRRHPAGRHFCLCLCLERRHQARAAVSPKTRRSASTSPPRHSISRTVCRRDIRHDGSGYRHEPAALRAAGMEEGRQYDRGKVMTAAELEAGKDSAVTSTSTGDGIPFRTYPGTHRSAAPISPAAPPRTLRAATAKRPGVRRTTWNAGEKVRDRQGARSNPSCARRTRQPSGRVVISVHQPAMNEALEVFESQGWRSMRMRIRAFPFHQRRDDFMPRNERYLGDAEPATGSRGHASTRQWYIDGEKSSRSGGTGRRGCACIDRHPCDSNTSSASFIAGWWNRNTTRPPWLPCALAQDGLGTSSLAVSNFFTRRSMCRRTRAFFGCSARQRSLVVPRVMNRSPRFGWVPG